MKKWTVLLLRPDYVANNYGQDTYSVRVSAKSPRKAVMQACLDAAAVDEVPGAQAGDYFCLSCIEGWHREYADLDGDVTDA
jgi:hypothetical protein